MAHQRKSFSESWDHAAKLDPERLYEDYARFLTVEGEDSMRRALKAIQLDALHLTRLGTSPAAIVALAKQRRAVERVLVALMGHPARLARRRAVRLLNVLYAGSSWEHEARLSPTVCLVGDTPLVVVHTLAEPPARGGGFRFLLTGPTLDARLPYDCLRTCHPPTTAEAVAVCTKSGSGSGARRRLTLYTLTLALPPASRCGFFDWRLVCVGPGGEELPAAPAPREVVTAAYGTSRGYIVAEAARRLRERATGVAATSRPVIGQIVPTPVPDDEEAAFERVVAEREGAGGRRSLQWGSEVWAAGTSCPVPAAGAELREVPAPAERRMLGSSVVVRRCNQSQGRVIVHPAHAQHLVGHSVRVDREGAVLDTIGGSVLQQGTFDAIAARRDRYVARGVNTLFLVGVCERDVGWGETQAAAAAARQLVALQRQRSADAAEAGADAGEPQPSGPFTGHHVRVAFHTATSALRRGRTVETAADSAVVMAGVAVSPAPLEVLGALSDGAGGPVAMPLPMPGATALPLDLPLNNTAAALFSEAFLHAMASTEADVGARAGSASLRTLLAHHRAGDRSLASRPDASVHAVSTRMMASGIAGGDLALARLCRHLTAANIASVLQIDLSVSASRPDRRYHAIKQRTLDGVGAEVMHRGSDGHEHQWEDQELLNYRLLDTWEALLDDIARMCIKSGASGVKIGEAQSAPLLMEADVDELFRRDLEDDALHYSATDILEGRIVLPNTECGYNDDGAAVHERFPNPFFVKVCRALWSRFPAMLVYGDCTWGREGRLFRSGVLPHSAHSLTGAVATAMGRRVDKVGRMQGMGEVARAEALDRHRRFLEAAVDSLAKAVQSAGAEEEEGGAGGLGLDATAAGAGEALVAGGSPHDAACRLASVAAEAAAHSQDPCLPPLEIEAAASFSVPALAPSRPLAQVDVSAALWQLRGAAAELLRHQPGAAARADHTLATALRLLDAEADIARAGSGGLMSPTPAATARTRLVKVQRGLNAYFRRALRHCRWFARDVGGGSPAAELKALVLHELHTMPGNARAFMLRALCDSRLPYPALLLGRAAWTAVDMLCALPGQMCTYGAEAEGAAFRIEVTGAHVHNERFVKDEERRAKEQARRRAAQAAAGVGDWLHKFVAANLQRYRQLKRGGESGAEGASGPVSAHRLARQLSLGADISEAVDSTDEVAHLGVAGSVPAPVRPRHRGDSGSGVLASPAGPAGRSPGGAATGSGGSGSAAGGSQAGMSAGGQSSATAAVAALFSAAALHGGPASLAGAGSMSQVSSSPALQQLIGRGSSPPTGRSLSALVPPAVGAPVPPAVGALVPAAPESAGGLAASGASRLDLAALASASGAHRLGGGGRRTPSPDASSRGSVDRLFDPAASFSAKAEAGNGGGDAASVSSFNGGGDGGGGGAGIGAAGPGAPAGPAPRRNSVSDTDELGLLGASSAPPARPRLVLGSISADRSATDDDGGSVSNDEDELPVLGVAEGAALEFGAEEASPAVLGLSGSAALVAGGTAVGWVLRDRVRAAGVRGQVTSWAAADRLGPEAGERQEKLAADIRSLQEREERHRAEVGPQFGFDTRAIGRHYAHRRALRGRHRVLRDGIPVLLRAEHRYGEHQYVVAFARVLPLWLRHRGAAHPGPYRKGDLSSLGVADGRNTSAPVAVIAANLNAHPSIFKVLCSRLAPAFGAQSPRQQMLSATRSLSLGQPGAGAGAAGGGLPASPSKRWLLRVRPVATGGASATPLRLHLTGHGTAKVLRSFVHLSPGATLLAADGGDQPAKAVAPASTAGFRVTAQATAARISLTVVPAGGEAVTATIQRHDSASAAARMAALGVVDPFQVFGDRAPHFWQGEEAPDVDGTASLANMFPLHSGVWLARDAFRTRSQALALSQTIAAARQAAGERFGAGAGVDPWTTRHLSEEDAAEAASLVPRAPTGAYEAAVGASAAAAAGTPTDQLVEIAERGKLVAIMTSEEAAHAPIMMRLAPFQSLCWVWTRHQASQTPLNATPGIVPLLRRLSTGRTRSVVTTPVADLARWVFASALMRLSSVLRPKLDAGSLPLADVPADSPLLSALQGVKATHTALGFTGAGGPGGGIGRGQRLESGHKWQGPWESLRDDEITTAARHNIVYSLIRTAVMTCFAAFPCELAVPVVRRGDAGILGGVEDQQRPSPSDGDAEAARQDLQRRRAAAIRFLSRQIRSALRVLCAHWGVRVSEAGTPDVDQAAFSVQGAGSSVRTAGAVPGKAGQTPLEAAEALFTTPLPPLGPEAAGTPAEHASPSLDDEVPEESWERGAVRWGRIDMTTAVACVRQSIFLACSELEGELAAALKARLAQEESVGPAPTDAEAAAAAAGGDHETRAETGGGAAQEEEEASPFARERHSVLLGALAGAHRLGHETALRVDRGLVSAALVRVGAGRGFQRWELEGPGASAAAEALAGMRHAAPAAARAAGAGAAGDGEGASGAGSGRALGALLGGGCPVQLDRAVSAFAARVARSNKLGPICFVTPELGKWSTVGGLGVMVDELTVGLARLGADVVVVSPFYHRSRKGKLDYLRGDGIVYTGRNATVYVGGERIELGIHAGVVNGVRLFFLHNEHVFPRPYPPHSARAQVRVLSAFARGVLQTLCDERIIPSMVVTNDWFTGMVPAYVRERKFGHVFDKTDFMHICHNLDPTYEGRLWPGPGEGSLQHLHELNDHLLVDPDWADTVVNPTRAALLCSDTWATVSRSYRTDLLEGSPQRRLLRLCPTPFAHANGIPLEARRARIAKLPARNHWEAKRMLQRKYFKMVPDDDVLLFGFVGRITLQKGVHLILNSAEHLITSSKGRISFIVGGLASESDTYGRACASKMRELAARFPDRFWADPAAFFYDGDLVNLGCDFCTMPSVFEPGGIVQHEFLVAGTPVLAFRTGGLKDSIQEFSAESRRGNGVTFEEHTVEEFVRAAERCLRIFNVRADYDQCRRNSAGSVMDLERVSVAWYNEFCRVRRVMSLLPRVTVRTDGVVLPSSGASGSSSMAQPSGVLVDANLAGADGAGLTPERAMRLSEELGEYIREEEVRSVVRESWRAVPVGTIGFYGARQEPQGPLRVQMAGMHPVALQSLTAASAQTVAGQWVAAGLKALQTHSGPTAWGLGRAGSLELLPPRLQLLPGSAIEADFGRLLASRAPLPAAPGLPDASGVGEAVFLLWEDALPALAAQGVALNARREYGRRRAVLLAAGGADPSAVDGPLSAGMRLLQGSAAPAARAKAGGGDGDVTVSVTGSFCGWAQRVRCERMAVIRATDAAEAAAGAGSGSPSGGQQTLTQVLTGLRQPLRYAYVARLLLPAGAHMFKFVVSDRHSGAETWVLEPGLPTTKDAEGHDNNLVTVASGIGQEQMLELLEAERALAEAEQSCCSAAGAAVPPAEAAAAAVDEPELEETLDEAGNAWTQLLRVGIPGELLMD